MEQRDHTYEHLTREFFSSLIYNIGPNIASTAGTIKLYMFNEEYEYSTNQLAELLHISYGEGVLCEAPFETDWSVAAFAF